MLETDQAGKEKKKKCIESQESCMFCSELQYYYPKYQNNLQIKGNEKQW